MGEGQRVKKVHLLPLSPADAARILPEETRAPALVHPPSAGGCRAGPQGTESEHGLALGRHLEIPSGH